MFGALPGSVAVFLFGLAAAAVVGAAVLGATGSESRERILPARAAETEIATTVATESPTPQPTPTPEPTEEVSEAPLARFHIPRFGVDAPTIPIGSFPTDDGGWQLDTPDDPVSVGWYDFTAKPGHGNAVFSAHVDWYDGEKGSFWALKDMEVGDEVIVDLSDGTRIVYKVTFKQQWTVQDIPTGDLIAPTAEDQVTLITCGGEWNGSEYLARVVVIAKRDSIVQPSG
jgi:LPXTG-site transpeptidase (sortase) family protein